MMYWLAVLGCAAPPDSTAYQGIFSALDHDHSGRIDRKEYAAAAPPVALTFSEADLNGNGEISRDEIAELAHGIDPARYDPGLIPPKAGPRGKPGRPGKPDGPDGGRGAGGDAKTNSNEDFSAMGASGPGTGFLGKGPPLVGGAPGEGATKPQHSPKSAKAPPPGPGRGGREANQYESKQFAEAVRFFAEEVTARDSSAPPIDLERLQLAMDAGPAGPARVELLAQLRSEVERVGLVWPAALVP